MKRILFILCLSLLPSFTNAEPRLCAHILKLQTESRTETAARKLYSQWMQLDRASKQFLGPPPFTENLISALGNYQLILSRKVPDRQRFNFAYLLQSQRGELVGYLEASLLRNASPSFYEQTYIGLHSPLTYLIVRRSLVFPKFRHSGMTHRLNERIEEIALNATKGLVVRDVEKTNKAQTQHLISRGYQIISRWQTPKGTEMLRFEKKHEF